MSVGILSNIPGKVETFRCIWESQENDLAKKILNYL